MTQKNTAALRDASPYNAAITREQFLFYEMRTTAKLLADGLSDDEAADRIVSKNLFQYPTEKSVRKMALACIRRLRAIIRALRNYALYLTPSNIRTRTNPKYEPDPDVARCEALITLLRAALGEKTNDTTNG